MNISELKFDKNGLIPVIIQDYKNNDVLMLAYMNMESLKISLNSKKTCFFSRSRQKLWIKGKSSGNIQVIKSIYYDCDRDTLLMKVKQIGNACHTENRSCFFRKRTTIWEFSIALEAIVKYEQK
jgi:phosphoribosyl-ATP pyrophosphohydrolase/phosphoribosyl-AMP cyclohydrolase